MARNGKALLSAGDILGARDLPFEDVEVPEWGGVVRISALSEHQLYELTQKGKTGQAPDTSGRAYWVAWCLVDQDGKRLFDEADVMKLAERSPRVISRLFEIAQRVNRLGDEQAGELEKNSEAPRGGISLSS